MIIDKPVSDLLYRMRHSDMIVERVLVEGQPYVDDPVYKDLKPKAEFCNPIAGQLAKVFGSKIPETIVAKVGHERVRLNWKKPDGKGGLIPR